MSCLLLVLALITPRLVILVLAVFTSYLREAYDTALWPILGFFFAPFTTLAYAWAVHAAGGVRGPFWIALIVLAVLIDVGALGGSARHDRSR